MSFPILNAILFGCTSQLFNLIYCSQRKIYPHHMFKMTLVSKHFLAKNKRERVLS